MQVVESRTASEARASRMASADAVAGNGVRMSAGESSSVRIVIIYTRSPKSRPKTVVEPFAEDANGR
jgi:hypothetical protein